MRSESEKSLGELDSPDAFVFPASFAQQRLWFLDRLDPGSAVYNIARMARILSRLDVSLFERSIREIARRHESLRTTFRAEGGEPFQVISSEETIDFVYRDFTGLDEDRRSQETRLHIQEDTRKPFDLERGPLFRTTLLKLSEVEYLLLFSIHHIVSDGWSLGILFGELAQVYGAFSRGEPSPLPPLPIQYADYSVWQRDRLQAEFLEEQIVYWKETLAGAPGLIELPTDRPRPAVQSSRGAQVFGTIPKELAISLRRLSRREGVTPFMTLLAVFDVLLFRYTGQQDIVVGSPIAGRVRTETESVIGLFANELVLRADLSGDPEFLTLLKRVRHVTLGAYAHQDLPFDKLVEELQPRRSLSHSPIFQVVFALDTTPKDAGRVPALDFLWIDLDRDVARADLSLFMKEDGEALSYSLEYNTDLFDAETVFRFSGHFQRLLESVVANPETRISRLPILPADERHHLLVELNDTQVAHDAHPPLHRLFEESAGRSPDAVAVACAGEQLTYGELNVRANQLAHFLRRQGVSGDTLVGVCMDRSVEMVVGLLGVLKAGAAYVPIDPTYPKERISYILSNSGVSFLLTRRSLQDDLPNSQVECILLDRDQPAFEEESRENPDFEVSPHDLAYLIYTSGSTGRPKGVEIPHRAVVNLLSHMKGRPGFTSSDTLLAVGSISFDISVPEIYLPLSTGGKLVLATREMASDGILLLRELHESQATVLQTTPATWRMLLDAGWVPGRTVKMLCGGEAMSRDLADRLMAGGGDLWNLYGPTETTVWSAAGRVEPGEGAVRIGAPIANTELFVLDAERQLLPAGVPGELYIGGEGLARGYHARPDLTEEKFVAHPFSPDPAARLYRTGDRARIRWDGSIEFLGRLDHQVKIRGYRVELEEIEGTLAEHPGVLTTAVIVREDEPGDKRLVAYFVPNTTPPPAPGPLRAFLHERLPEYMVPQVFMALDVIPLTANAKVDRAALPAPDRGRPLLDGAFVEPRTTTEKKLAEIWRRLLDVDSVGIEDDFFELGGHSLKAAQLVSRVRETFEKVLPLRSIFEFPTIAGLASRIDEANLPSSLPSPIVPVPRDGPLPLSFGQQRLWFLNQLEPDSTAYNISRAVRLRGALDRKALVGALEAICARHESLRTTFTEAEGDPRQVVSSTVAVPLEEQKLDSAADDLREGEITRAVWKESDRSFDLEQGPLWRILLLQVGPDEHIMVLTIHHIVSDGSSFAIFFREFGHFYSGLCSGTPAVLPDLSIQYADYAVWQRERLRGEELEKLLRYWRTQLAGAPEVLSVAGARQRPPQAGSRGAFLRRSLSSELTRSLEMLGRREGTTRFTTLVAAFQTFLMRPDAGRDIVVGTDVANRDRVETEALIGFLVNLLPIRTDLAGNPRFREALARVRDTTLGAYAHQELPFEKLVEELRPTRVLGVNPVVQVLIVQSQPREALHLPGLVVEEYPMPLELALRRRSFCG